MDKREEFINEARKVHGDKYNYSKVEYKKAHDKMCIICPKHGEFWQDKFTHLNGHGCPKCAREKVALGQTYTQEEFIERCKKVWGDRYSYEHASYNGITKKVIITCPIHGDFEIIANDFINGHGCSRCSGTKKLTTEEFIEKARKVHGDRYDYSKVKYINNHTKVCIVCPVHGEFWQRPSLHLVGDGCYKCFQSIKKTTVQFIEEARKIHGDKYDYSKVDYQGNKKPIIITCPTHGDWKTTPLYHLQGHGCLGCNESSLERATENLIRENNKLFIRQKKFDWLGGQILDFYIPTKKLAIECQGEQHFRSVGYFGGDKSLSEQIRRDITKNTLCSENGVKLIYLVKDKNEFDYTDPIYNGIYNNNIYLIDEIKEQFL